MVLRDRGGEDVRVAMALRLREGHISLTRNTPPKGVRIQHASGHNGVMTLLLAVTGVAPAVGKSTLARALRDWLVERGMTVDHLEEDELVTRPELAPIAREIAVQDSVGVDTLVATLGDFVDSKGDDDSAIVMDGLFPFVSLLSEWGYGEHRIAGFCTAAAARLASTKVIVCYLDANPGIALHAAASREPPGWLDWYVGGLARTKSNPSFTDFEAAMERLSDEREMTLRLVTEQGWELVTIPHVDMIGEGEVIKLAQAALEPALSEA